MIMFVVFAKMDLRSLRSTCCMGDIRDWNPILDLPILDRSWVIPETRTAKYCVFRGTEHVSHLILERGRGKKVTDKGAKVFAKVGNCLVVLVIRNLLPTKSLTVDSSPGLYLLWSLV